MRGEGLALPTEVLITAGPTHEPIDPVRFLGNRSSGTLGVALAEAALRAGHRVTLLLGPVEAAVADRVPPQVGLRRYGSTAELEAALAQAFPRCGLLIMAAAVADYRPVEVAGDKLRRGGRWTLELEATPDLVAGCVAGRRPGQRVVAFALEPADSLRERALTKLRRKGVDALVANPLQTLHAPDIDATLLWADGRTAAPGPLPKPAFATWLLRTLLPPAS